MNVRSVMTGCLKPVPHAVLFALVLMVHLPVFADEIAPDASPLRCNWALAGW